MPDGDDVDLTRPAVTLPHPPAWPIISEQERREVDRILASGELYGYKPGGVIQRLEQKIGEYHGGVPYVLAQGSGTEALHAAYLGIGLKPGDEVIVPALTYVATATPLFLCGAVPVLCDVEAETGNIDPEAIEGHITANTRAIVVTHLWGHPAEMDRIVEIAHRRGLKVVEDCSHAHGSRYRGRHVGTIGDVGIFSMGAAKMVTGGMGGALMTRDPEVYDRALILGHCRGRSGDTLVDERHRWLADTGYGANHRITALAACLCLSQFESLDARIAEKHGVLNRLNEAILDIGGIAPPMTRSHVTRGAWYTYAPRYCPEQFNSRPIESVFDRAREQGMRLRRPRSGPLHLLEPFQRGRIDLPVFDRSGSLTYGAGDFPIAEKFYDDSIGFPTKNLHFRCDAFLDQYVDGLRRVFDA